MVSIKSLELSPATIFFPSSAIIKKASI
uniref:Uncharacterized protein n=1 Tax=Rhizophora mucronata TaxID=61149 RepID=A0A2P2NA09_RHIMU